MMIMNLGESSKGGYGSKRAALPMMMIMIHDLSSVSTFAHTQEVRGSNIGQDTGYSESGFS
jgi:hypothetical protein